MSRMVLWDSAQQVVALTLMASMVLISTASAAETNKKSDIRLRYERAEKFGSGDMNDLVFKSGIEPHWIGDNPRFWYRNDVDGGKEFIFVDAERGVRRPAFDHARLAAALSTATGAKCVKDNLPFDSIAFIDTSDVAFRVGSQWWKCDLKTYECAKTDRTAISSEPARPQPKQEEQPKAATMSSPDGQWLADIKDDNIYLKAQTGGDEKPLSAEGTKDKPFTSVSWSPNGKYLAAWQTKPGDRKMMYVVESSPESDLRPKLHESMYELPGDKVDVNDLWTFDIGNGTPHKAKADPIDWWGPVDIRWRADGQHFTYEQIFRGYQTVRIVEVDASTGESRTVVEEKSKTFVWPACQYSHYMEDTNEIIWASERDGWCHLYLIDWITGKVKNQITKGEWVVRSVENVDEKARQILFTASGREAGQDPYLIHYYRVNFDGTGLVSLTPGNGQHSIRFSPDRNYYIDTYSRVDMAPVSELRRASDGSLICPLEKADISKLLKTGWPMPIPFCAKARDGKTDIWGAIFRPSNMDPKKKYPVIEDIYAGPQGSFAPKTFSARRYQQALAELGFVVVQVDGLGTGNRSKAFHDVCYKNLGDSGFPDRILWMKAAAKKYPYMDITRVGVYGTSAGGYNAAHALIAHPEFYKVAVSQAGNHDHRTDKVWWNELWMGYPIGPHYAEQSNIVNADKLKGKLLLVHGELDDNVNPSASTLQFVNALIKANKDFDLLIVPGAKHGNFGAYGQRRLWDYFVKNLQGIDPPEGYQIKSASNQDCTITIKNLLDRPVEIFWVDADGKLQKYPDVKAKATEKRHTIMGHQWEAHVDGKPISWFTATRKSLYWEVGQ